MTPEPAAAALSRLSRSHRLRYALISLALLIPCFWQPRIQAGDLSSHIYNAWLAQLIESGRAGGLRIVSQTTNILFDLFLSGLFRLAGPEWAQRAAVSSAVLIFVWGAFAFISTAAGRRAWHLIPAIAMLAYGWVFHMGFFNFYLSLGLCFWALALVWNPQPRRVALAAALLLLAYIAHALPVVWTAGLILYVWIGRRVSPRARMLLMAASLALIVAVRLAVSRSLLYEWSLRQLTLATGADQVWVFDGKYYFLLIGLLAIWGSLFLELIRGRSRREVVSGIPFQLSVLSAAGVFTLPTTVALPGYNHSLVFIGERMSLGVGICVCAMLAMAQARAAQRYGLLLLASVYFLFLFQDERALNGFEDRMDEVVAQLPPGQRVVGPIIDPGLRVNALAHMVDRACMGRCFSYANYEPSTAQFRIRAVEVNPVVAEQYNDAWELQTGRHVVKDHELPLYRIDVGGEGQMAIQSLKAGVLCRSTLWEVLKNRTPSS
ncbi:MAG TPA: hypothetical protein VG096_15510 [Bryobacteraceae bacterium]|jgi:hypothetical protein|nr:hypothetical protein [Bryobacteraceae bacterium]